LPENPATVSRSRKRSKTQEAEDLQSLYAFWLTGEFRSNEVDISTVNHCVLTALGHGKTVFMDFITKGGFRLGI